MAQDLFEACHGAGALICLGVLSAFRHSIAEASALFITIGNEVSGFACRVAGNNILSAVLPRMLATFEFTHVKGKLP